MRGLPVVLDAMGGDAAPAVALRAAEELAELGVDVLLCGHPDVVGAAGLHAPDVVGMSEEPAFALRARPGASVRVAAQAVASGRASALVSAGSTGATVAAALLELGRSPGVRRPVIAARIPASSDPTSSPDVLLLDVGAAPDADADVLVAAARLGVAHARRRGVRSPTVGLLNVGEEAGKGDALRRVVHERLAREWAGAAGDGGGSAFIGNVEPAGLLGGRADVVVTDGFTGNIVLKAIEAVMRGRGQGGGGQGGDSAGVLLGVEGTVLVAHGAATSADLVAAVCQARDLATPAEAAHPAAEGS